MIIEKLIGYHMGNSIEEAAEVIHTYLKLKGFMLTKLTIEVEYNFNKNRYNWKAEVATP